MKKENKEAASNLLFGQQPPGAYPIHDRPPVGLRRQGQYGGVGVAGTGRRRQQQQQQQQQRNAGLQLALGDHNERSTSSTRGNQLRLATGDANEQQPSNFPSMTTSSSVFPEDTFRGSEKTTSGMQHEQAEVADIVAEPVLPGRSLSSRVRERVSDTIRDNLIHHVTNEINNQRREFTLLVQATPFTPTEEKSIRRSQRNAQRKNIIIVVLVGFLLLVLIGIIVAVTMTTVGRDETAGPSANHPDTGNANGSREEVESQSPTDVPTGSPTTSPITNFVSIPMEGLTYPPMSDPRFSSFRQILYPISGASLEDETSYQYQAFQWLLSQDGLQLPVPMSTEEVDRLTERYILAVLYFATSQDREWDDDLFFLSSKEVCGWFGPRPGSEDDIAGVECVGGIPISLFFARNGLNGVLPTELAALTSLESITIVNDRLRGQIPDLSHLSNLLVLDLYDQWLDGTMPPEMGDLTNLVYLDLGKNYLSGTLPSQLGQLTRMKSLYLEDNVLSGTVPQSYSNIGEQLAVDMDGNDADATIWFHENLLSGDVALLFCPLENNGFREVWVDCYEIKCGCCRCD